MWITCETWLIYWARRKWQKVDSFFWVLAVNLDTTGTSYTTTSFSF